MIPDLRAPGHRLSPRCYVSLRWRRRSHNFPLLMLLPLPLLILLMLLPLPLLIVLPPLLSSFAAAAFDAAVISILPSDQRAVRLEGVIQVIHGYDDNACSAL